MKLLFVVIVSVAAVDCRSHFKPQSEPLEGGEFSDGSKLQNGNIQKGLEKSNLSEEVLRELYQGDILLTENQFAALRERRAIGDEDKRWTEGPDGYPLVPYIFSDYVSRAPIMAGLDYWMEHTCIKFEETWNTDQPHLRFVASKDGRCKSSVGMEPTNGQNIQACTYFGTVVHEIGHAMGFWHEHSRSDRDTYLTVKWDNIERGEKNWNYRKHIGDNNFSVPYDYSSVMHYPSGNKDINKAELVTNDVLDMDLIGQRRRLSHRDKLLANRMYNCTGKWVVECGLSTDPCLNDGYTGKDCTCVCPQGTSGAYCEEKVSDYYGTPGCGGNFNLSSGAIRHPMNSDTYGDGERCSWHINANVPIKITFNSFDTENNYDYLYIRDGENVSVPVLGKFTGQNIPSPVQIRTNMAYILFKSDRDRTRAGFELQWEPSGIEYSTTQSTVPTTQHPIPTPGIEYSTTQSTVPTTQHPIPTPGNGCTDEYSASTCTRWANLGYCEQALDLMTSICKKTCNKCVDECKDKISESTCKGLAGQGYCESSSATMTDICEKTCNKCGIMTVGGSKCIFPFLFEGVEYNTCAQGTSQPHLWCATALNKDKTHKTWDVCVSGGL